MRPWRTLAVPVVLGIVALLAAATFVAASYTAVPRCDGVRLRTGPSTAFHTKLVIDRTDKVTVVDEVAGSKWSTLCGGNTIAGSTWAKVSAVDGVTVKARFGIDYLYAAAGLLRAVGPVSSGTPPASATPATPTPTPTATPGTTPETTQEPATTTAPSTTPSVSPAPTRSPSRSGLPLPSGSPGPGGAGSLDSLGTAGQLVILVLAVLSAALSWIAFQDRRRRQRQRAMSKLPPSRLNDILS